MRKLLISMFAIALLAGCTKEEVKTEPVKEKSKQEEVNAEPIKEDSKQEEFNPEEFLKEAEKHGLEWYVAESGKLKPEELAALEKFQADQEAKELEVYQSILEDAEIKESVNDEGQKVFEYKMVNRLGHDVEFFQLQWVEGTGENVSQTADNVKDGQEFTLIVDPAFDKTLDDIDLNTVTLTGS